MMDNTRWYQKDVTIIVLPIVENMKLNVQMDPMRVVQTLLVGIKFKGKKFIPGNSKGYSNTGSIKG